ncbi:MAG: DUF362 domain-containing protein [Fibrobacter sp.]|nr:DUF362 domain-containing protein [Fibrobacter sp.]
MAKYTRRNFIKSTVLGTGVIMASGQTIFAANKKENQVFVPRMSVNPQIDNLRVICGVNKSIITGEPSGWDMTGQNTVIDAGQVDRTMDAIAISLTRKESTTEAWKTIFRKPETKSWEEVKAAIKVNCIGKNHPRVAVVNKICTELGKLGVKYQNIYIYDGSHNAGPLYSPYIGSGLPAGVIIGNKNNSLGGTIKHEILEKDRIRSYKCTRMIADGSIDILINLAVNKSHDKSVGGTTLTLKNHAGTFEPFRIHTGGGLDYILGFSKSNALWGGNPVRQQLCIIDSLWGSVKGGPFQSPDTKLDCIVMGTCSGVVDYLTAKKLREPLMGAQHGPIERFITEFGYQESEMAGWEMISV